LSVKQLLLYGKSGVEFLRVGMLLFGEGKEKKPKTQKKTKKKIDQIMTTFLK